jgi:hypoxanthine phosphoribosyltransferase
MNDEAAVNLREYEKKLSLNWGDFESFIDAAAKFCEKRNVSSVFGIPRGGLPIAVRLSHKCGLRFIYDESKVESTTLICDDVADTGNTLKRFKDYTTLTWIMKKSSAVKPSYFYKLVDDDVWVVFPWEVK